MLVALNRASSGNGEPLRNKCCRASHVEIFDLGDELKRAATAITVSKAAPHAAVEIDHECSWVVPAVDRTTPRKLRPDALEPSVEAIVRENGSEGNGAPNTIDIDRAPVHARH